MYIQYIAIISILFDVEVTWSSLSPHFYVEVNQAAQQMAPESHSEIPVDMLRSV